MSIPTISAVIMARDEAANIADAIASLSFADQIIVADTGSKDNTLELAANAGAETHSIIFDGYGASKNRAIAFAKCDWVFSMDADERVTPELAQAIKAAVESHQYDGYEINRLTYFLGKAIRHSGWFPEHILRLFRNGKGRFDDRLVHESIILDGRSARLDGLLNHYSYRDLESYIEKFNIYSEMSARDMVNDGRNYNFTKMLFYPPATFFKMYIQKLGFLDGYHGLLLAGLSSFHVLVKYAKFRELYKQKL